jgi:hypothetical protein
VKKRRPSPKAKRKVKPEPKRRLRSKASPELVAALKRFEAEADAYWAKLKIPDDDRRAFDRALAEEAWPHRSMPAPVPAPAPTPAPEDSRGEAPSKSGKGKKREPKDQWQITEALLREDHPQGVPKTARTANLRRKLLGIDNKRWKAECERRGIAAPAPSPSTVDRVRKSLAH